MTTSPPSLNASREYAALTSSGYLMLMAFLVAVALYAPIVFALVSLQRWIERRQAAAEVAV